MGSFKNYFNEMQRDITDVEKAVEDEISREKDLANLTNNKKKDE